MPGAPIKKFYSDPICSICNRQVKGWARAFCDNSGKAVCRKHRPLFVSYWQCPTCIDAQKSFLQNNPTTEQMMEKASAIIESGRSAEASKIIDQIFVDIFTKR